MDKINNIDYFFIENNKFKTNTITVYFKEKTTKENALNRQILPKILLDKTKNYDTKFKLSRKLSSLYSSSLSVRETIVGAYSLLTFSITYIQSKYLNEDISDEIVSFLTEVIYNPYIIDNKFDDNTINRLKNEFINIIKQKDQSFPIKTKEQGFKKLYNNQSITDRLFTKEDINKIDNKKVCEYYNNLLNNNEMLLVFEGDKDIKEKLSVFNTNTLTNNDYNQTKLECEELGLIVTKDKTKQTNLMLIYDNFNHDKEYTIKNIFFAMLLGETPNSLLFQEIREKHSLAYSIGAIYDPFYRIMMIQGGVKLNSLDKTLELINDIFNTLKTKDLNELIEETKQSYLNSLYSNLDTKNYLTIRTARNWLQNSYSTVEDSIKKLNSITSDDIKEIANQIHNKIIYVIQGETNESK